MRPEHPEGFRPDEGTAREYVRLIAEARDAVQRALDLALREKFARNNPFDDLATLVRLQTALDGEGDESEALVAILLAGYDLPEGHDDREWSELESDLRHAVLDLGLATDPDPV